MTPEQDAKYNALREECRDLLLEVVDGNVNINSPQPITHPKASCLIAEVIEKLGEIDLLVDGGK